MSQIARIFRFPLVALIAVTGILLLAQNGTIDFDLLDTQAVKNNVHKLVNDERQKTGLKPLSYDTNLEKIAKVHSEDMTNRGFFAHASPEGIEPNDRALKSDYRCVKDFGTYSYGGVGENIALNYYYFTSSPEVVAQSIVEHWMSSTGHRANILEPEYDGEGIGIATDGFRVYATQMFC